MASTKYLWDVSADAVAAELDDSDSVTTSYQLDAAGALVAETSGTEEHFHHYDAEGSTRELTNSGESVTDSFVFTAFGETVDRSGTSATQYTWLGEVGYRSVNGVGVLHGERAYCPGLGRWTSLPGSGATAFGVSNPSLVASPPGWRAAKKRRRKDPDPSGPRSGNVCAAVMFNKPDGKIKEEWLDEAINSGAHFILTGVSSPEELAGWLRDNRCCTLFTFGHRGNDDGNNEGGTVSYPGGKRTVILPSDVVNQALAANMKKHCSHCAINVVACGDRNDPKGEEVRKKMAIDSGCIVCGSVGSQECGYSCTVGVPGYCDGQGKKSGFKVWMPRWNHVCTLPPGGGWTKTRCAYGEYRWVKTIQTHRCSLGKTIWVCLEWEYEPANYVKK